MLSMLGLGALKQRQHIGSSFPFPSADSHAPPVHAEAAPSPSPVCGPKSPCHQSWASTLELRRTLLSRVLSSTTIGAWHHSHRPRLSPCAKLLAGVGMASLQNSQVADAHNLDSCLQSVRLCPGLLASLQRRCSLLCMGFGLLGGGATSDNEKKFGCWTLGRLCRLGTKFYSTVPSFFFASSFGLLREFSHVGPSRACWRRHDRAEEQRIDMHRAGTRGNTRALARATIPASWRTPQRDATHPAAAGSPSEAMDRRAPAGIKRPRILDEILLCAPATSTSGQLHPAGRA